jgi:hypothetical protein
MLSKELIEEAKSVKLKLDQVQEIMWHQHQTLEAAMHSNPENEYLKEAEEAQRLLWHGYYNKVVSINLLIPKEQTNV